MEGGIRLYHQYVTGRDRDTTVSHVKTLRFVGKGGIRTDLSFMLFY